MLLNLEVHDHICMLEICSFFKNISALFPCQAAAPAGTDDAWGSPAPPLDSTPSSDPFGDGASKKSDPWGAPSQGTGKSHF